MSSQRLRPMRAPFVADQVRRGECKCNSLHGDPGPTVLSSADNLMRHSDRLAQSKQACPKLSKE
jgi:hypothetical protein